MQEVLFWWGKWGSVELGEGVGKSKVQRILHFSWNSLSLFSTGVVRIWAGWLWEIFRHIVHWLLKALFSRLNWMLALRTDLFQWLCSVSYFIRGSGGGI